MIKVFETRVTAIGSEAADMINAANMLILFGQGAPADLADFCYTIDNKQVSGSISAGGQLVIDQMAYDITAVGAVRSEERRVGNECRSRWSPYHYKTKYV